jgi:hypothetical protein
MGMYDYVTVNRPEFVCSEGHDLSDEEFQTKCFDCVFGYVHVGESLTTSQGPLKIAPNLGTFESHFDTGAVCKRCPAFVQAETFNVIPVSVDFRVYHQADKILKIVRISSESTADFLASTPTREWMGECRGPFPYRDAQQRQRDQKFFPWDPVPTVTEEQAAAQKAWRERIEADRKRYAAMRLKEKR